MRTSARTPSPRWRRAVCRISADGHNAATGIITLRRVPVFRHGSGTSMLALQPTVAQHPVSSRTTACYWLALASGIHYGPRTKALTLLARPSQRDTSRINHSTGSP